MSDVPELHEEEVLGKVYDGALMRRLLAYVRPYRGMLVAAVSLVVLSSGLQLVGPLATAVALDLFVEAEAGAPQSLPSVWMAGWLEARGWSPAAGLVSSPRSTWARSC